MAIGPLEPDSVVTNRKCPQRHHPLSRLVCRFRGVHLELFRALWFGLERRIVVCSSAFSARAHGAKVFCRVPTHVTVRPLNLDGCVPLQPLDVLRNILCVAVFRHGQNIGGGKSGVKRLRFQGCLR